MMKTFIQFLSEEKRLKTSKGSVIKRSKLGVGKDIGGTIYLHKQYKDSVPDQDLLKNAEAILDKEYPEFKYNVIKYGYKNKVIGFVNSPDFDTSDEPVAGEYVNVFQDGKTKHGSTKSIWHHKWLWVKDDYKGFDVGKSFERSEIWLQIPDIDFARIGNKELWDKEYVPKINKMISDK